MTEDAHAEDTVETARQYPEEPIVLSREDRLELENLQLRHMNAIRSLQLHQAQGATLQAAEDTTRMDYVKMLTHMSDKYGFDPATHEMDPGTGVVRLRRGPAGPGPSR